MRCVVVRKEKEKIIETDGGVEAAKSHSLQIPSKKTRLSGQPATTRTHAPLTHAHA
jgi:hypothetical protein